MEWRLTIELNGADGTKQAHEVARGGGTESQSLLDPLGLTLDDGKTLLAGVQRHLVQVRVAEYSTLHRYCSHRRVGPSLPASARDRGPSAPSLRTVTGVRDVAPSPCSMPRNCCAW